MNAVMRALKVELGKVEKRLENVVSMMDANPIGRILDIRTEAQCILDRHKDDTALVAKMIEPLAREEKAMFILSKKQISPKLCDERVVLEDERCQLVNALYCEERKAI